MKAAGILLIAMTGNALFLRRTATAPDTPGMWDFPGGGQEGDETAEQTAIRETREEIGHVPEGVRLLHTRTRSGSALQGVAGPGALPVDVPVDGSAPAAPPIVPAIPNDVDYTTFLQRVTNEFVPELDSEHDGYAWSPVKAPPEPLHPGCRIALDRVGMNELDIARAIADGRLTSPQRYENVLLCAIRITGTDVAYRNGIDEFVYRNPDNYLNQEFLARCNGLIVLFVQRSGNSPGFHPAGALLNSEEFAERAVGSIFLPYISGNEVWAIAKIYDDAAAEFIEEDQVSTSPSVFFRDLSVNAKMAVQLKNGEVHPLLIEGNPSLLDHVCLCEKGVWDKGGQPTGVRSESRADAIAREVMLRPPVRRDSSSGKIDKLGLALLNMKMRSYTASRKSS